jgi:hypothetical protein
MEGYRNLSGVKEMLVLHLVRGGSIWYTHLPDSWP